MFHKAPVRPFLFIILLLLSASQAAADAKVYWSDFADGTIERANPDGSQREVLFGGINGGRHLYFDEAGGYIYWTDWTDESLRYGGSLRRSRLDGSQIETLISRSYSGSFAVDSIGGKIYWVVAEGGRGVYRADLDGSNVETFVELSSSSKVLNLEIDQASGKLYLVDVGTNSIKRINLDGSGLETVVNVAPNSAIGFLTLDEDLELLFWSAGDSIFRANLDGSSIQTIYTTAGVTIADMAVGPDAKLYWSECPGSCYIWHVSGDAIYRSEIDGSSIEQVVGEGALARGLDTRDNGDLCWIAPSQLKCRDADSGVVETLVNSEYIIRPADLVIEQSSRSLYWLDATTVPGAGRFNRLMRAQLDGSSPTAIFIDNFYDPTINFRQSFGVDESEGVAFYVRGVDAVEEKDLYLIQLDGSGAEVIESGFVGRVFWDSVGRQLYKVANSFVERRSLSETSWTRLYEIPGTSGPYGLDSIFVDFENSRLLISVWHEGGMIVTGLDGSNSQEINGIGESRGVVYAEDIGRVFYANSQTFSLSPRVGIWSFNSELTEGTRIISEDVIQPIGIAYSPDVSPLVPSLDINTYGSFDLIPGSSISGTAQPGSTVRIYIDGEFAGEVTADASGNWTFTPSAPLPLGAVEFEFEAVDAGGLISPRSEPQTLYVEQGINSTQYILWNTFLRMRNVATVSNTNPFQTGNLQITLFDQDGLVLNTLSGQVPPLTQIDVVLDDLASLPQNASGLAKVTLEGGALKGSMFNYSFADNNQAFLDGAKLAFMTSRAFENLLQGESFVSFNTYWPGTGKPAQAYTANWLQIANTDPSRSVWFDLYYYSYGELVHQSRLRVPPMGRRDVQGGHEIPGGDRIGYIKLVPHDDTISYSAQLGRYGVSPGAAEGEQLPFADVMSARVAQDQPQLVRVESKENFLNWLVLSNVGDSACSLNLLLPEAQELNLQVPVQSQLHLPVSSFIPADSFGSAQVSGSPGCKFLAESNFYSFDEGTGALFSTASSQGRSLSGGRFEDFSYNTYLNQQSLIRVYNTGETAQDVLLSVFAGNAAPLGSTSINVPAGSGTLIDIGSLPFAPAKDSYGLAVLESESAGTLHCDSLRVQAFGAESVD